MIVRMSSSIVSNHGSKNMMGASVNMAITIFGFVLSALFIVVICCRLLCSRFRHRGPQSSSLDNAFDRRRATMSSVHSLDSYICFGIKIFMFCFLRSLSPSISTTLVLIDEMLVKEFKMVNANLLFSTPILLRENLQNHGNVVKIYSLKCLFYSFFTLIRYNEHQ